MIVDGPPTDISEHLPAIFYHAILARPRLIVELGTRGGESTRALLAAARELRTCRVLSVDVNDCVGAVQDPELRRHWYFEQGDDVDFAEHRFGRWCELHDFPSHIDVLFVDTSHEYGRTCRELEAWLPLCTADATLMFHDTNCPAVQRGVIRAIEDLVGERFDETRRFAHVTGSFVLLHEPACNGLTVLCRRPAER